MKITMAQINPVVGDLEGNLEKILRFYQEANRQGSDLIIFPELVITGYPPQDLIFEDGFVTKNLEILSRIARATSSTAAVLGFIDRQEGRLYNAVALLQEGRVKFRRYKTLLPTYDVFDEQRYFTPSEINFPIKFQTTNSGCYLLGLEICEDLWDEGRERQVTDELFSAGADLVINISASPYSEGKRAIRRELVSRKVKKFARPMIYVNLVGGQDELVFDGSSFAVNEEDEILASAPAFQESMLTFNLNGENRTEYQQYEREEELFQALVLGTKDYFHKTGFSRAIVGLSGGIDSALTAVIGTEALGKENLTAVYMPSYYSSDGSRIDSEQLAKNLGISYKIMDIRQVFDSYLELFKDEFRGLPRDVTEENIQARIRGNILMALANKYNAMVLVTGNKTELALGYCTLYGDMCGALGVISDINKMDVYNLARWYNRQENKEIIPASILEKTPSAELKEDQVDPFDYPVVSPLVEKIVEDNLSFEQLEKEGFQREFLSKLHNMIRLSEYKRRQAAPGLKISPKAFGFGRRYPIVNHYKR